MHQHDGVVDPGRQPLDDLDGRRLVTGELQLLEHWCLATAMDPHPHHAQEGGPPWQRQREDVACREPTAHAPRSTQATRRGLWPGQAIACRVEDRAPLRDERRRVLRPGLEVRAPVDSREGPIADGRIEATHPGLGHRERDDRDAVRLVEGRPEPLDGLAGRTDVIGAILDQLAVVVADVTCEVVREQVGPPGAHGGSVPGARSSGIARKDQSLATSAPPKDTGPGARHTGPHAAPLLRRQASGTDPRW